MEEEEEAGVGREGEVLQGEQWVFKFIKFDTVYY